MMKGKSRKTILTEEKKRERKREKNGDIKPTMRMSIDGAVPVDNGIQVENKKRGNSSLIRKGKKKDKDIVGRYNSNDEVDLEEQSDGVIDNYPSEAHRIKAFKKHRGIYTGAIIKPCRTKKAKKKKKKEKEDLLKYVRESPERGPGADQDEIYIISSGDEDCSKGMKKWIMEYHQSRPELKFLKQQIDDFMTDHDAKLEQERKDREAHTAEGGWTVVVHHKGRKKTTDYESGIAVGSVAQPAVEDKLVKKKHKEVPIDFYRFQKREAQRNEIMMLQSKFEEDKKGLQQLRASRKFRPYRTLFRAYLT